MLRRAFSQAIRSGYSAKASTTTRFQLQRVLLSSSEQSGESAKREARMTTLLTEQLKPTKLMIQDVSGGCGAMYAMEIESPLFQGKTLVAQHRLVNQILAKEISEMHGLSLKTKPSPSK